MRSVIHCFVLCVCVRALPNPTRLVHTRHPDRVQCSFIREWLETYHCLFIEPCHCKMHFHVQQQQQPAHRRITKMPRVCECVESTTTVTIADIANIYNTIPFKRISYNAQRTYRVMASAFHSMCGRALVATE